MAQRLIRLYHVEIIHGLYHPLALHHWTMICGVIAAMCNAATLVGGNPAVKLASGEVATVAIALARHARAHVAADVAHTFLMLVLYHVTS